MKLWYLEKEGVLQYCRSPRLANEYIAWPAIRELSGDVSGKKVLDLGTGGGDIINKFAELGALCTGVDISPRMLEIARETSKQRGLDVNYLERDCENLEGINNNEFDLIVMVFLLCNISSREGLLSVFREGYRVTRPEGKAIFTIHHPLQLILKKSSLDEGVVSNEGPSGYFASGEKIKRFLKTYKRGIATVHNYHWTIEDYINSFTGAGFLVDAVKEPKPVSPPREFEEEFKQAESIPLYLVVRGVKK